VSKVVPGIELFLKEKRYRDLRLGLITNPTGVTSGGVPSWKSLLEAGYRLTALFGPEHGFRGESQDAVQLKDDTFQGIKTFSLYGEHLKPTEQMLEALDLMVFDIQDVGCRYYTYLYTLGYAMEACQKAGKKFVVLDRPNPIGSHIVEGGPIEKEHDNFVGGYGLAHRYGLTIGEYARYVRGEFYPDLELTIVALKGYRREMLYPECGLPWISPSPNLPTLGAALVYPGTCLFEGTNLSEGRGTTRPFETIGAPWLDGERYREQLTALHLPGIVFTSLFFTPEFSKHSGSSCQGVMLHVTDNDSIKPLYTAVNMLWQLKHDYPQQFEWKRDWEEDFSFVDRLAGGPYLRTMLDEGESVDDVYRRLCQGRDDFLTVREKYLLY